MEHHKYIINHAMSSFGKEDIEICLTEGCLTENQLRALVDEHNAWHGKPCYDEIMSSGI